MAFSPVFGDFPNRVVTIEVQGGRRGIETAERLTKAWEDPTRSKAYQTINLAVIL